ncbi:MAG: HD domain-containing phosphohydrolase [Gammaproteobacteria bacterium]|nr:HD domain-containing phosphohydrolase [Gammaproteobacteria bacterium]
MTSTAPTPRLSLHITISTLFIILVLIMGLVLSLQNFNKTSDIILSDAGKIYDHLTREAQLDFMVTYRPLVHSLQLLTKTRLPRAASQAERLQFLPLLAEALNDSNSVTGIQIGYANGDYFIMRPLVSDYLREQFDAPPDAAYVVDSISAGAQGRRLERLYFDTSLNELRRNPPTYTDYDPRQRPWYLQADTTPGAVKPFMFYFVRKPGTTISQLTSEPGVVIGTDVTLDQFAATIDRYRVSPGSEAVLLAADGRIFAYQDQLPALIGAGEELPQFNTIDNPVLAHLASEIGTEPGGLNFEFDGQRWIGKIEAIAPNSRVGLVLVMVSPVSDLLADALAMRQSSLVTAAVILAVSVILVWYVAGRISTPLRELAREADAIRRFDFDSPLRTHSFISEVELLGDAMRMVKTTINHFLTLINSLAGEKNFDALLAEIALETMRVAEADAAVGFLVNDDETGLQAEMILSGAGEPMNRGLLPKIELDRKHLLVEAMSDDRPRVVDLDRSSPPLLIPLLDLLTVEEATLVTVPLRNRKQEEIGLLCLLYSTPRGSRQEQEHSAQIDFVNALSGFAAVSIESRQLLKMQQALFDSFIKLIAGAIDSKSPYTGGHCARVPELTFMLAQAACNSSEPPFADFRLDEDDWEALHIAGWLHDCGKVTTPEFVVDKATKLETIYDRIHEVRMRFEVLKRDAEISFWQQVADGSDRVALETGLATELAELDADFAFVAECNLGGEFMDPARLERLQTIGQRTWRRTLDDRLGVSWEELQRMQRSEAISLPTEECLLADKAEHVIKRPQHERMPVDNPWGFRLDVPEHMYNRGELYNLSVGRGTLSHEERFKINDHMVQTIIMLNKLPYPKHLRNVPEIAGGHHETMDGKGYPKRLTADEMSIPARMMAIADIFEALTASDRPYKKAKTLSQSLFILGKMRDDRHIDPDLFALFLKSGVWRDYADEFLVPEQRDEVDINDYL